MKKVLFVCHGNICRSPMAEYIFKYMTGGEYIISSRATSTEEIGNDIYPEIKKVLDKHGIPYKRHYAKQITKDDYNYYDYIIAFDDYNVLNIKRLIGDDRKVMKITKEGVADPWYTRDFEKAYHDTYIGCKNLYEFIKKDI